MFPYLNPPPVFMAGMAAVVSEEEEAVDGTSSKGLFIKKNDQVSYP